MADFDAIREFWSNPPKATAEELFERAGLPLLVNHKGTNVGFPALAERHRWDSFVARPTDIWLTSLPRSGTTWTSEIIHSLLHLGRAEEADAKTLLEAFPYFELSMPHVSAVDAAAALDDPRTIKSHLAYDALPESVKSVKPKIVYVCRNPKDYAVSWYNFMRSWKFITIPEGFTFQHFLRAIMNAKVSYTPIFPHMLGYWKRRNEPNILFLQYEDMQKDLPKNIRRIAAFLGVSSKGLPAGQLNDTDLAFVVNRTSFGHMVNSVRANKGIGGESHMFKGAGGYGNKGKSGGWRSHFSDDEPVVREYDAWIHENLKGTGLAFDYD